MEILIVLLTLFLGELVKNITKDLWKLVKKRIKKATFTPKQRRKGGKPH
ncbi:MAG: hypothetical protein FWG67_08825 [Defluviitaleaceae bacterium]|nr:hypothetical protein [Defluviitaleaceae bacterium]